MIYSTVKLIVVGVLAVTVIVALLIGLDAAVAVPILTLLVGYVVGNANVTDNHPIVAFDSPVQAP